jgi:hypothetical protein
MRVVGSVPLLERVAASGSGFGGMMNDMTNRLSLEMTLARHCAPVLMGKKPAALFPKPAWWDETESEAVNMRFLMLRRDKTALVFAYCPRLLFQTLESAAVREALRPLGYPLEAAGETETIGKDKRAAMCLGFLERRFRENRDFPHEVGFFLGYPPEDVLGFMRHRGNHCKLCGMWKVYGDVPKAAALFAEYARCRDRLLKHVQNGGTILRLPLKRRKEREQPAAFGRGCFAEFSEQKPS